MRDLSKEEKRKEKSVGGRRKVRAEGENCAPAALTFELKRENTHNYLDYYITVVKKTADS